MNGACQQGIWFYSILVEEDNVVLSIHDVLYFREIVFIYL